MNKPSLGIRILVFFLRLLVVLALMAGIAILSFQGMTYYLTGKFYQWKKAASETKEVIEEVAEEPETLIDNKNLENTLLIVDGKDQRTEYIFLSLYNKDSKKLDVVLVPANAVVKPGDKTLKTIREKIPDVEEQVELEDIAVAFGPDKYKVYREIFAELTGLEIHGYDAMTLDQFRQVLDAGPKVSYNIQKSMSYRDDKDILHSIDAGQQMVDGEQGIALITHLDGTAEEETSRLERAGNYISAYLEALTRSKKASDVVAAYEKNSTTERDEGITSVQDVIDHLKASGITVRTMQGGEDEGLFYLDAEKIQLQMAALAKQTEKSSDKASSDKKEKENDAVYTEGASADLAIEIYNAAYVEGLAARWEEYLTSEGYNISMIDSYQSEGVFSQTRIRVTEDGMGEDLLEYFPDAEIYVDEIATGGDIRIYLGSDSTNVPEITNTMEDPESNYYNDSDGDEDSGDDSVVVDDEDVE